MIFGYFVDKYHQNTRKIVIIDDAYSQNNIVFLEKISVFKADSA